MVHSLVYSLTTWWGKAVVGATALWILNGARRARRLLPKPEYGENLLRDRSALKVAWDNWLGEAMQAKNQVTDPVTAWFMSRRIKGEMHESRALIDCGKDELDEHNKKYGRRSGRTRQVPPDVSVKALPPKPDSREK